MIEPAELRGRDEPRLYHCIIRDMSRGGARLRVPLDFPKQGEFNLIAKAVGIDGPVRIIWRAEHSIGVSFVSDDGLSLHTQRTRYAADGAASATSAPCLPTLAPAPPAGRATGDGLLRARHSA